MKKSTLKISISLIVIALICFGLYFVMRDNSKVNEHIKFEVKEAKYIEKNYDRYVSYKNKHPNYTDDEIVTYVNIGLDKDFYSETLKSNENDGQLIIVNKYYALSNDYVPDLTPISTNNDIKMEKEAGKYLDKMVKAASDVNVNIEPLYGYISYDDQTSIYNSSVNLKGENETNKHFAKPGHSDYQTGLAIALNIASQEFQYSFEYDWLKDNAYKYGFIVRYPKEKEMITGFEFEPWHFRYVGVEVANIIHEKNMTFEEYYATYVLKDE